MASSVGHKKNTTRTGENRNGWWRLKGEAPSD